MNEEYDPVLAGRFGRLKSMKKGHKKTGAPQHEGEHVSWQCRRWSGHAAKDYRTQSVERGAQVLGDAFEDAQAFTRVVVLRQERQKHCQVDTPEQAEEMSWEM